MDPIISGAFGLLGAVLGAALAGMHQRNNTKKTIEAEFKKIHTQIAAESKARFHAQRQDQLIECVAALVTEVDPYAQSQLNHKKITSLIYKIQVILDPRDDSQGKINHWSTKIGLAVIEIIHRNREPESLLEMQGELIEATRLFLRGNL